METRECANCCVSITENDQIYGIVINLQRTRIVRNDEELRNNWGQRIIKVESALSSIYKLNLSDTVKHSRVDHLRKDKLITDGMKDKICVCRACGDVLSRLYELYLEFGQLCNVNSYLHHEMEKVDKVVEKFLTKRLKDCDKANNKMTTLNPTSATDRLLISSIDPLGPGPWVKLSRLTQQQSSPLLHQHWQSMDSYNEELVDSPFDSASEPDNNEFLSESDNAGDTDEDCKVFNRSRSSSPTNSTSRILAEDSTSSSKSSARKQENNYIESQSTSTYISPKYSYYNCSLCHDTPFRPSRAIDLANHLNLTHITYSNSLVDDHMKQCPLCPSQLNSNDMMEHLKQHCQEMRCCSICDEQLVNHYKVSAHIEEHFAENPQQFAPHTGYTCEDCGKSFFWVRFYNTHRTRKHGKRIDKSLRYLKAGSSRMTRLVGENSTSNLNSPLKDPEEKNTDLTRAYPSISYYKCPLCPDILVRPESLVHLVDHLCSTHLIKSNPSVSADQTQCPLCPSHIDDSDLKAHLKEHCKEFKCCSVCNNKSLLTYRKRIAHIEQHFAENPQQFAPYTGYTCKICGKTFFHEQTYTKHRKSKLHKKPRSPPRSGRNRRKNRPTADCQHCSEKLESEFKLRVHYKAVHPGTFPYTCRVPPCDWVFYYSKRRDKHELTHSQKNFGPPAECPKCKEIVLGEEELYAHMRWCKGNIHLCTKCGNAFNTGVKLAEHMKKHDREKDNRVDCPVCGSTLSSAIQLKVHMRYHTDPKSYACPHCPYVSYKAASRRYHVRHVHLKIRDRLCATCGKGFKNATALRRHNIQIHVAERIWKCELDPENCSKTFTHKGGLQSHQRLHQEKKLCTLCPYTSSTNQGMKLHTMKHHPDNNNPDLQVRPRGPKFL